MQTITTTETKRERNPNIPCTCGHRLADHSHGTCGGPRTGPGACLACGCQRFHERPAALVIKLADLPAFLDELERKKLEAFNRAFGVVTAPPRGGRCKCGAQMIPPGSAHAIVDHRIHRLGAECDPAGPTPMVFALDRCWSCRREVPEGSTGCPHCGRSFTD